MVQGITSFSYANINTLFSLLYYYSFHSVNLYKYENLDIIYYLIRHFTTNQLIMVSVKQLINPQLIPSIFWPLTKNR